MRVLLDTHVFLWAIQDPSRLSRRVREILEDPKGEPLVSSACVWEMSIKHKAGRWPEVFPFMDEQAYAQCLDSLRAVELPITGRHGRIAGQFDSEHRDPFDRVIAAQSFLEGLPLLSKDDSLDVFPVTRIW